jgi:hypothetical protein
METTAPRGPIDVASTRGLAVEANDRGWTLSEQAVLTPDEENEMLHAAHAAAHHWSRIGSARHLARANLLLGRVHSRVGNSALAMRYARAAYDVITSGESEPWEVAFAHAILADSAFASGDHAVHAQHYERARTLGAALADPEDRRIFDATFDQIPRPGGDDPS